MSSEVSQNNIGSTVGGAFTSSAIMTGGFGSLSCLKRNKGIKNAIEATKYNNKVVKEAFKNIECDSFTKSYAMGQNYNEFVNAQKQVAKLNKIKKSKLPSWMQKILHPFTDVKNIDSQLNKAVDNLDEVAEKLAKGTDLTGITAKSFTKNIGSMFKSEFKDPLGIFFAFSETATRFTSQALPAFKNEGFVAGMKETGKALLAGGMTLVTDAGLSVAFRTIGATIGGFLGPLGASIGSIVGNAVGGMMSNTLVQKIFPTKGQTDELAQDNIQQEVTTQAEQPQVLVTKSGATMPLDKSLTPEQVKQLAYAQAFQGKVPQVKYYA